jgi:hypothetical protein
MPTYGIDELDRAATAVFGAAGLEVFEVDVSLLYRHTGSLRCQVGVIRRGV